MLHPTLKCTLQTPTNWLYAKQSMRYELEHLEELWDLAQQNAGFGVWDLDVSRHLVRYSPRWKAMLGYEATDEVDSTAIWRARVHPEDLAPMLKALSGHLEGAQPVYTSEFRLRTFEGEYRWMMSRGRVVEFDAEGRPLRAVGTLTDLTDRRAAEQMRAERDRAEAASEAKTAFLSRMSHELRTPLNAVLGFAQLLKLPTADAATQQRYVDQIERAGWRLLHLVDDVLDLSRLQQGRVSVQRVAVALQPMITEAVAAAAASASRQGLRILVESVPTDAAVHADPDRLRQVLDQLLSNAVKFNRDSGEIQVGVAPLPGHWTVWVQDTGVGMSPDQLDHVFEAFNRSTRGRAHVEGIGIGLSLARSLVELMGGRIDVRSEPGAGSTFSVTLPSVDG
jgi:PAS domain S-box-containing protein